MLAIPPLAPPVLPTSTSPSLSPLWGWASLDSSCSKGC